MGLPLTSSEKLNSEHSKLRDYCSKAAQHLFFSKTTVISDKRYAYFDILAKVATIEIEGLDAGLRYDDVKKVFKSNSAFSPNSATAKRINNALKLLHDSFPASYAQFRNRTIVQSIITLVCHLQEAGLEADQKPILREFIDSFFKELRRQVELGQSATDQDFLEFQRTVNANIRAGARTRQSILLRHLFRQHPEFFSAVSQSQEITDGMKSELDKLATGIRESIRSINERYGAQHGSDLFKSTNRTAGALVSLGTRVSSFSDYKNFIEELYFLFWEAVGQRLEGNLPESFKHVNDLRTMLEHDVDHGKKSKVASKRKHLATVFRIYSGAGSPEAIDPTQFALVQVNILGALNRDLNNLAKTLV